MRNYMKIDKNKIIYYALILFLIIIVSALASRFLTRSNTLADYAKEHPEIAYPIEPSNSTIEEKREEEPKMESTEIIVAEKIEENPQIKEEENSAVMSETAYQYKPDFYYDDLNDEIIKKITGVSYPYDTAEISYQDLKYLSILYYDFNDEIQTGEIICNQLIADDLIQIFYELYRNHYQLEKVKLIDEYGGDDELSMRDNNTSCFNYRNIANTTRLSNHALGMAVDINPFYNPYVVYAKDGSGKTTISPAGSEPYVDRTQDFPYKIDENDLAYRLFTEHGFTWGGNWNSSKDYQHFEKALNQAE